MHFLLEFLAVVLLVDFVSGLVHWSEDTLGTERTPLVGWIIRANVLHHRDARAFVPLSYWRSNWDLLAVGVLVVLGAWWCGCLSWQVWLFVLLGGHANQLHKWAHMPRRDVPLPVRVLQHLHVLQSPAHHALHHRGEKNAHYCVVTELLDPVLDRLGFWRGLERACVSPRSAPRRIDLWRPRSDDDGARDAQA